MATNLREEMKVLSESGSRIVWDATKTFGTQKISTILLHDEISIQLLYNASLSFLLPDLWTSVMQAVADVFNPKKLTSLALKKSRLRDAASR